jgi:cytochrome P450
VTRRLTKEEVLGYCSLLAGAGNETTTRLIGWTGKILADHPDQRRQLVEDRGLIPNAIEELLRYEPPSPVQARVLAADVEHDGQTVPKDSVMLLLNAAANRDERKFDEPDRFDIHRKIGHHLTFGYGIHFCLGAALARLEGPGRPRRGAAALSHLGGRLGQRRTGPDLDRPGVGAPPRVHALAAWLPPRGWSTV